MTVADEASIRALVATLRRSDDRRRVLAIRAEPRWTGPDVIDGPPRCRVVPAASPLAARAAVIEHVPTSDDELLVLLTTCTPVDLGLDLQAQLIKGTVQSFDPFAAVLALFKSRVLDPALARQRWLIDELISLAPAGGWLTDSPLSGALTEEMAWDTWQHARIGFADPPTDLAGMLALETDIGVRRALADLDDSIRDQVARRWAPDAPTASPIVARLLAGGTGPSPTALGLVTGLLWAATDDPAVAQQQVLARARLEPALGRDQLSSTDAGVWADASLRVLAYAEDRAGYEAEAERTLADVDGLALAVLSDQLPRGLDARIERLGAALLASEAEAASVALADIERHQLAARRPARVSTCAAAVRLLRRSAVPAMAAPDATLADLASGYRADGAWHEQARRDAATGEQPGSIATALAALVTGADTAQQAAASQFAAALALWSASSAVPDPRLCPVESFLVDIVAPVARDVPVLVVVCDGMGLAVSHQLVADLRHEGWAPARPAARDAWPVGVAVLPTVTSCSRTTLLSGLVQNGSQPQERAGFAGHPDLRAVSTAHKPPLLFHKAGLVAASGLSLPDEVRAAVADPEQRVVGVVVNSVDDHLARGDQINLGWDLASLGPLAWLLEAAAEADRVVILTADHGHVLDRGRSVSKPQPTEGGERWRQAANPPGEGEIVIAGPRVALGGGRIVMPFDDRIRYGPPKHGYHGGATPEEVLVPIEVLVRRLPEGWTFAPPQPPTWWNGATPTEPRPSIHAPARSAGRRKVGDDQPTLFGPPPTAPAAPGATWVDSLLASAAFAAQRAAARLPRPLPDDRLRRYLDVIADGGNSVTLATIAAVSGEPAGTLRMTLSVVQRLLNLDGADILSVRDDLVVCNVELLALQYDLDLGTRG